MFNATVIKGLSLIDCSSLPPTSAAAENHSYRVFHQIQTWLDNDIKATNWGRKLSKGENVPVSTLLPVAPAELIRGEPLHFVHAHFKISMCSGQSGQPFWT